MIKLKYVLKTIRLILLLWFLPLFLYIISFFSGLQIDWFSLNSIIFLYSIPSIYLFIEYSIYSFNKKIEINPLTKQIIINSSYIIPFEEVKNIEQTCSYPFAEKRRMWLSSDTFFFYKINLINGNIIIITSLMCDSIYNINKQTIIIKRLFPVIICSLSK